jgi:hypothetical protein
MTPSLAGLNLINRRSGDAKAARNPVLGARISTDCANRLGVQFGKPLSFASRLSLFLALVLSVLGARSEEQMIGMHASRVVTGMANAHAIWDCPVQDFPCNPVCRGRRPIANNEPVAVGSYASGPDPAVACFVNSVPKVNCEIGSCSRFHLSILPL